MKKTKRFLTAALAAVMTVSMGSVSASAEVSYDLVDVNKNICSVSNYANTNYKKFVFQATNGSSSINELCDCILYPDDKFTYIGYKTWNTILSNDLKVETSTSNSNDDALITVSYYGNNIPANSKIYSLVFEVNMSKYNGTSSLLDSLRCISIASKTDGVLAMLGDVNEDGKITTEDAKLIAQFMLGTFNPTKRQKVAMDVNMDGNIDLEDAIAVQSM